MEAAAENHPLARYNSAGRYISGMHRNNEDDKVHREIIVIKRESAKKSLLTGFQKFFPASHLLCLEG